MNNNSNKRRTIIKLGFSLPLLGFYPACRRKDQENQRESLKILILGGTSFLGPHQIAYAIERGHHITTFTRGKTKPTIHQKLFEKVEMLTGDRAGDLEALKNRDWDAVIDNSGHNVDWTRASSLLLKDHCDFYLYTSSTGVYYPYLTDNIVENQNLVMVEPEGIEDEEEKLEYWYGVMKANSEEATKEVFGVERTIIVRPTYMIGPADKSNRFIHWPVRLAQGGEILVPGTKADLVQYIDVRDVAEWMIRLIEEKKYGTYNAVGPESEETMEGYISKAGDSFDSDHQWIWVDDYDFLKSNGVTNIVPWIMPEGNNYGSARINNQLALANGLALKPLQTSMNDTYNWWISDAASVIRNKFEADKNSVIKREKSMLTEWKKKALSSF